MKELEGRVAVVTGASSGLGRGIAEKLAEAGARVVLAARRKDVLDQVAADIKRNGGAALAAATDVTKEADVVALFRKAHDAFGRVDILVNNAGIPNFKPTEEMSLADWQAIVDLNLTGPFLCSREALKIMKAQGGGRIITTGSISAWSARPNAIGYNATKAALEGLTRSLTLDGRNYGVVASIVHPGAAASGFTQGRAPGAGATPQEYLMSPEHVARVVLLMCTLPPEVNLFDATILPNHQPSFIGRG